MSNVHLAEFKVEGGGFSGFVGCVQKPFCLFSVGGIEAALVASVVILNVVVRTVFPSEHPVCVFHAFYHVLSIRETWCFALASTRRATSISLEM